MAIKEFLLKIYDDNGEDMTWTTSKLTLISIKDMTDNYFNECFLKVKNGTNPRDKAWCIIFQQELMKKRARKIDKIKEIINTNENR